MSNWRSRQRQKDNNGTADELLDGFQALSIANSIVPEDRGQVSCNQEERRTLQENQAPLEEQSSVYSQHELQQRGLLFCGFTEKRLSKVKLERNEMRFRGNYGVSSLAVWKAVDDLLEVDQITNFSLK